MKAEENDDSLECPAFYYMPRRGGLDLAETIVCGHCAVRDPVRLLCSRDSFCAIILPARGFVVHIARVVLRRIAHLESFLYTFLF